MRRGSRLSLNVWVISYRTFFFGWGFGRGGQLIRLFQLVLSSGKTLEGKSKDLGLYPRKVSENSDTKFEKCRRK